MTGINIHFSRQEFAQRQSRVRQSLEKQNLDGALLFKIEDMYWLTGYDSDGFSIFGCMFIGTAGKLTHLARLADLGNSSYSSICEDVRVAPDSANITRAGQIKEMLASLGMQNKRIGIQVDTMGLTPRLFLQIQEELRDWCELIVIPDFIRDLRLIKSPKELSYLRKAGEIMDITLDKTTTKRKDVMKNDQVTLELGVGYRHYHAASMCVVLTGPNVSKRHLEMHETSVAALDAVQSILRPGKSVGEIYDTYRETLERNGETDAVLTVCGYTMGAAWPPTWMEQPLIFEGNPTILEENMSFFTHMILNDRETGM